MSTPHAFLFPFFAEGKPVHGRVQVAKAAQALRDPASFATTLALICTDQWGTEWLNWHPETIQAEIRDTWKVEIAGPNFARLMAAVLVLTTDRFFKEIAAFNACCAAFSGNEPAAEFATPPDALECAWGITEALILDPVTADPHPFTDDVRRYLGVVVAHEGLKPVDVLRVAILSQRPEHPLPDDPGLRAAAAEIAQLKQTEILEALRSGMDRLQAQRQALGLGDAPSRVSS